MSLFSCVVICHFNYISGTVALAGECIQGYHNKGKYHLTSNKTDVAYYKTKSECLLNKAKPLMDIYRIENKNAFDAFISSDANIKGTRKRILSSLPIHTISDELLLKILKRNKVSDDDIKNIISAVKKQKQIIEKILKDNVLEDEISKLNKEDFDNFPPLLSLSNSFYENNIYYNYEEYLEHLSDTQKYMDSHKNYRFLTEKVHTFRNIDITIRPGNGLCCQKILIPLFILLSVIQNFVMLLRILLHRLWSSICC